MNHSQSNFIVTQSETLSAACVDMLENIENEITECISSHFPLTETQKRRIAELIPIKNFKKGTHLLREGEVFTNCFGVLKGCVRRYYNIGGEEKTTFFYTEDQSILALTGNNKGAPAKFNLVCVEDCRLSVVNDDVVKELFKMFPPLEEMRTISYEEEIGNYQQMLDDYITSSPEQRYMELLQNRPELLNRVPQYQLASYLGVKPESLSRIRKRIFVKKNIK